MAASGREFLEAVQLGWNLSQQGARHLPPPPSRSAVSSAADGAGRQATPGLAQQGARHLPPTTSESAVSLAADGAGWPATPGFSTGTATSTRQPGEIYLCRTFAKERRGSLQIIAAAGTRWDHRPRRALRIADIATYLIQQIAAAGYFIKADFDHLAHTSHLFYFAILKLLDLINKPLADVENANKARSHLQETARRVNQHMSDMLSDAEDDDEEFSLSREAPQFWSAPFWHQHEPEAASSSDLPRRISPSALQHTLIQQCVEACNFGAVDLHPSQPIEISSDSDNDGSR